MIDFDDTKINERLLDGHILRRTDPFGFWIILNSKNRQIIPGAYTNQQDAAKALKNHLANLKPDKKS